MKIKSYFVKIKENIIKLYNKNKKLLISTIALVVVIFGFIFFSLSEKNEEVKTENIENIVSHGMTNYEEFLEKKLENVLLNIDEVSSVKVMVVCDSSVVYHYLKDVGVTESSGEKDGNKTLNEEVVYEKDGSNSKPVVVSYDLPKVVGVMVVISGVSPSTKLSILNSISVVLNVSSDCISIVVD